MKIALVGSELEENLALRSIHAAVVAVGNEAEIFDFHGADQADEVVECIRAFGAEIVGLSMVFTARAREFVDLARVLRDDGFAGHLTAGGHFASFNAEALLGDVEAIDSVLHGEGEEATVDLAANLEHLDRIRGITFRDPDGRIVSTAMRPAPDDLDVRPRPTRPDVMHTYLGKPIANMLSGRGCFGNCSFCSISAWHRRIGGKRFRQRRVECVAAEMSDLYHQRGARIFNFHDDNFFLPDRRANVARFRELKRLLDRAGIRRIGIQVKARPDSIDDETIAALVDVGLFRVFLGVESNAVAGLRCLGRGITRERNDLAVDALKRARLHVTFNLLMFEPDCTMNDLRDNVDYIRRHADVPLNFCRVEVYAGTPIERRLREQGRLEGDYFGWTYAIADETCERAYRIFRTVFTPRNFMLGGMNLRAMTLDYNLHLLRHFHPRRVGGSLVRRTDAWIRELNANNVALLERIFAFALTDAGDEERFAGELSAERIRFDERMNVSADALLDEMRAAAADAELADRRRRRGPVSIAAAALLATALGCPQAHEMAPPDHTDVSSGLKPKGGPADTAETAPTEMAPEPPRPAPPKPEEPEPEEPKTEETPASPAAYDEETTQRVQAYLQKVVVPKMQFLVNRELKEAADAPAWVELDADGTVTKARCDFSPESSPEFGKTVELYLRGNTVPGMKRAGSCNIKLHLQPGLPTPEDGPHIHEMVPRNLR